MTFAVFFKSFTAIHLLVFIPLMAWGLYLGWQQWRHRGVRPLLGSAGLAFAVAVAAQIPFWRGSTPLPWALILFATLAFWICAFFAFLSSSFTGDVAALAFRLFNSPAKRGRRPTLSEAKAHLLRLHERRPPQAAGLPGDGVKPKRKPMERKAPEPEDPARWADSPFSIEELSEGYIRSGAVLHFMYEQGPNKELFSIHRNEAWGNFKPEYEFRARLPFRDDGAAEEVIRWRLRAAQRMASFMESDPRVRWLPGRVDLRDLETFNGRRPDAIFW